MTNCDSFLIVSTKMYIVGTPVYLNLCIRKGTPCSPSFTIEKWDSGDFSILRTCKSVSSTMVMQMHICHIHFCSFIYNIIFNVCIYKMSCVMKSTDFCICENKGADQLRG